MAGFSSLVSDLSVSEAEEAELRLILSEVRTAQRCLDGLALQIGVRCNHLAKSGRAAPAAETLRGDGAVGSRQARREAVRADTGEAIAGVSDALLSGSISGEHVDSIARHRERLPEDRRKEVDFASLVDKAKDTPPETFDRLVRRQVDRAIAEHRLADTKAKQRASEFRHWFDHETGFGCFAGSLDPERYEVLTNAIAQRTAAIAAGSGLVKNKHLAAQALVDLVIGSGATEDGRSRVPSVLVVVDYETLQNGKHPDSLAQTEQGHTIAAESLARLCCDAALRRVTLDERGVPINVGRTYRTATDGQWAALKAIHSTCAWDGCFAPIGWCQAHHIREWEHRGRTDLNNLVPLCSTHHHRVHEGRWHIELLPDRSMKMYKPDGALHATVPTPMRC